MIDTTHAGLPTALPVIRGLGAGDVVAFYDTGSSFIEETAADLALIPAHLTVVMIDQGYTGSPNFKAKIRDCENGAWQLERAVDKTGWDVDRPTLYLGYPDTMQQAHDLGWRGDVWIVMPSPYPPTSVPTAPPGINIVGIQWNFSNPNWDGTELFDPTWPLKGDPVTTPPVPVPPALRLMLQEGWDWCKKCQGLFYGPNQAQSVCPAGETHDGSGSYNYPLLAAIHN